MSSFGPRRSASTNVCATVVFLLLFTQGLCQQHCVSLVGANSETADCVDFEVQCGSESVTVTWAASGRRPFCSKVDWGYDCYNNTNLVLLESEKREARSTFGGPIHINYNSHGVMQCVFYACVERNGAYFPLPSSTGTVTCPSPIPTTDMSAPMTSSYLLSTSLHSSSISFSIITASITQSNSPYSLPNTSLSGVTASYLMSTTPVHSSIITTSLQLGQLTHSKSSHNGDLYSSSIYSSDKIPAENTSKLQPTPSGDVPSFVSPIDSTGTIVVGVTTSSIAIFIAIMLAVLCLSWMNTRRKSHRLQVTEFAFHGQYSVKDGYIFDKMNITSSASLITITQALEPDNFNAAAMSSQLPSVIIEHNSKEPLPQNHHITSMHHFMPPTDNSEPLQSLKTSMTSGTSEQSGSFNVCFQGNGRLSPAVLPTSISMDMSIYSNELKQSMSESSNTKDIKSSMNDLANDDNDSYIQLGTHCLDKQRSSSIDSTLHRSTAGESGSHAAGRNEDLSCTDDKLSIINGVMTNSETSSIFLECDKIPAQQAADDYLQFTT